MAEKTKSNKMNRIVILNIIGTLLYQGINFILTPILTRALGGYEYGIVTLYTSWVNLLLPILSLSVDAAVPLVLIYVDEKDRPKYFTSLLGLSTISFGIIGTLMMLFIKPICNFMQFRPIVVVMLIIQCYGMMLVRFIISYYVQHQKTVLQFTFSITVSLLTCFTTLALLHFITDEKNKYLCRIIGFAVPYFAVGIVILIIFAILSRNWLHVKAWKFALPICVPFIFHTLSHIVLNQSGKIIIQRSLTDGVEKAGYYGFAYLIATIMQIIWTAFNNAWVPYYYKLLRKGDDDTALQSSKNYMNLYTGGFMAFALVSPEVTLIMGGEKYMGAEKLVLLLLIGVYFIYLYSFAVNYKTYQKRTLSIAMGTIIAATVNFILCLLLTPRFSYWGSAVSMVVSYLVLLIVHQLTINDKQGQYRYPITFFLFGAIKAIGAIVLCFVTLKLIFVRWIIALGICAFLLLRIIKQKRIF